MIIGRRYQYVLGLGAFSEPVTVEEPSEPSGLEDLVLEDGNTVVLEDGTTLQV